MDCGTGFPACSAGILCGCRRASLANDTFTTSVPVGHSLATTGPATRIGAPVRRNLFAAQRYPLRMPRSSGSRDDSMIRSNEETACSLCEPISPREHPPTWRKPTDDCRSLFEFDILCAPSVGVLTTIMQCLSSLPIDLRRAEFAGASRSIAVSRLFVRFQVNLRDADLLHRKLSRLVDVISIEGSTV